VTVVSLRLQYAMQNRLEELGWREIEVVDDNLGQTGFTSVCSWQLRNRIAFENNQC